MFLLSLSHTLSLSISLLLYLSLSILSKYLFSPLCLSLIPSLSFYFSLIFLFFFKDETSISHFLSLFGRQPVVIWHDQKLGETLSVFRKGRYEILSVMLYLTIMSSFLSSFSHLPCSSILSCSPSFPPIYSILSPLLSSHLFYPVPLLFFRSILSWTALSLLILSIHYSSPLLYYFPSHLFSSLLSSDRIWPLCGTYAIKDR